MPVRIIFRGSILFNFKDGELRAQLVNDPHARGVHNHRPRIALIAQDESGQLFSGAAHPLAERSVVTLTPLRADRGRRREVTGGVTRCDGTFSEHVPKLASLLPKGTKPGAPREEYVSATIVVPAGRIRAGRIAGWGVGEQERMATMRFLRMEGMDCFRFGHCADETIVEIDDSDVLTIRQSVSKPKRTRELAREGATSGHGASTGPKGPHYPLAEHVAELSEGNAGAPQLPSTITLSAFTHSNPEGDTEYVHESDPDWIDVLVTNFPPQRLRPVPWGMHFQSLFQAAGYDQLRFHECDRQQFSVAARQHDPLAWLEDIRYHHDDEQSSGGILLHEHGAHGDDGHGEDLPAMGLPFPFVSGATNERLTLADERARPTLRALVSLPEGCGRFPAANSPESRPICLQGCGSGC